MRTQATPKLFLRIFVTVAHLERYLPVQAAIDQISWWRIPVDMTSLSAQAVWEAAVSREIECAAWAKSSTSKLYCFGQGRCIVGLAVDPKTVNGAFTTDYLCKMDTLANCGGIFSAVSGSSKSLTSHPWYGASSYDNSMDCDILIQAPVGLTVRVQFQNFNTESCCDHLYIYDGSDPSGTLLATLDDLMSPPPYQSSGRDLFLHFKTDSSVTKDGYSLVYDAL